MRKLITLPNITLSNTRQFYRAKHPLPIFHTKKSLYMARGEASTLRTQDPFGFVKLPL